MGFYRDVIRICSSCAPCSLPVTGAESASRLEGQPWARQGPALSDALAQDLWTLKPWKSDKVAAKSPTGAEWRRLDLLFQHSLVVHRNPSSIRQ